MNTYNFIGFTMLPLKQLLDMLQLSSIWCHVRWGHPVLRTGGAENELDE